MSLPQYNDVYNQFDAAALEAEILDGRLESGLNVCHEICDRWAGDPKKVGLYYEKIGGGDGALTFAELKAASARFANYLKSLGVTRGDRVAGLLPRGPELLIVIAGTLRLGAVYQPLFTAFGSGAIEYRLEKASTRLVVTDPDNYPKLEEVKNCPPVLCLNAAATGADVRDFDAVLAEQSDQCEPVMITGNDPFLQMFTSGTVGKAKGVAVPAKALLAFYVMKYATHFNLNPFTPESTYEMIRKYRTTNLAAAPTAYRLLKASPLFHFDGYTWGEKDPFVNGYYLTGDMVICHGDGSFSFSGRDDDIITTAGYRVGPADVESTLLEHAAVAEAGVVAKPDEKRGSIIKAYVVIKSGQEPADDAVLKEELKELVRHRLSTHAYPREIEFVDELPKTPSGKIQRFVLRNRAKEEVAV